ncbi:lipopolysaccharide assembly protein LapB [Listeria sp. PSOL-1]|uniref:tetratricopeptide repeat protein n=1 Tax=Listeria sp. PSOL-1 TaxID=1844999 RepID=UPI0013D6887E|nr:hypothetical protein [Listeria sp. PSOL-1]
MKKEVTKIVHFLPSGQFYFQRGLTFFREENLKEAIRFLKRANELEPREPVIMCQLAICYTEIRRFYESNQLLRRILEEISPEMTECYYFIANNFAYMKDYRRALQYVRRYLELNPNGEYKEEADDLAHILLEETPIAGMLESRFSHYEQEFYEYKKEINQYLAEEDSSSACQFLEKVLNERPNFWPAYNQLAALYFEQLLEEKGLKILADLLERNPGNLLGLADMYHYYYFKNQQEKAHFFYHQLKNILPVLAYHKERLAIIHAMAGEYKQAWRLFQTVDDLEITDRARYCYYYAKSAFHLDFLEESKAMWQQFLDCDIYEHSDFPWHEKVNFADDIIEVLTLLDAEDEVYRFIGVYALSISATRAEIVLFHPLFDMSKWSYLEHLIFTKLDYLPDTLEQNGAELLKVWHFYEEQGLSLSSEYLSFYHKMASHLFKMESKWPEEKTAELAAFFLVHCLNWEEDEAAAFCHIDVEAICYI